MYIILGKKKKHAVKVSLVVTVTHEDGREKSLVIPALGAGVTQINLTDLEIDGFLGEKIGQGEEPER